MVLETELFYYNGKYVWAFCSIDSLMRYCLYVPVCPVSVYMLLSVSEFLTAKNSLTCKWAFPGNQFRAIWIFAYIFCFLFILLIYLFLNRGSFAAVRSVERGIKAPQLMLSAWDIHTQTVITDLSIPSLGGCAPPLEVCMDSSTREAKLCLQCWCLWQIHTTAFICTLEIGRTATFSYIYFNN